MAITISVSGKDFLKSGVKVGDLVVVTKITNPKAPNATDGTSTVGKLLITKSPDATPVIKLLSWTSMVVSAIINQNTLSVDVYDGLVKREATDANLNLDKDESFEFTVRHILTKDEQVEYIGAIAKGYASKRVLMVWPPAADWDEQGTIQVDGSAMAALVSAAMSRYPAQQGFTNLKFSGPYRLKYSNDYFSPLQLKRLSEAGVFVLMQDAPGAQIYVRHQVTTSTVSIQEAEFSITKSVDQLSRDIKQLVKPFIGPYNVTNEVLGMADDVLRTYLFQAKTVKAPKCGGLILGYSNLVLKANLEGANPEMVPGTVAVALTVEVGYPLNNMDIVIYVN